MSKWYYLTTKNTKQFAKFTKKNPDQIEFVRVFDFVLFLNEDFTS